MRGEEVPMSADILNETVTDVALKTRQYRLFQQELTRYWQAVYFKRELAENPINMYEAKLVSWIKQVSLQPSRSCQHISLPLYERKGQSMILAIKVLLCDPTSSPLSCRTF